MSEIIQPTRRGFITGLTSLIVAPAIVRVESLMPVKVVRDAERFKYLWHEDVIEGLKVGDVIKIKLPNEYWQMLNGGKPRDFKII